MRGLRPPVPAAAAILLAGCAVGRDYVPPSPEAPPAWSAAADGRLDPAVAAEASWWRLLRDPVLDDLVDRALRSNRDLRAVRARVKEARAVRRSAAGALLPTVDAAAEGRRHRSEAARGGADLPGGPPEGLDLRDDADASAAGLDLSWEIDLFGARRREAEAAGAEAGAAEEERRGATVALLGEVVRAYAAYRGADARAAALGAAARASGEAARLTGVRVRAGLADAAEEARALARAAGDAAEASSALAEREAALQRLGLLAGEGAAPVRAILGAAAPVPAATAAAAVGLPADVLRRRPDVRRAERMLAAAVAGEGAAEADFYPRVSLAAALGVEDDGSFSVPGSGSRAWRVGSVLRLPLFAGGRLRAAAEAAGARAEAALAGFEGAVLRALADAETAMSGYLGARDREKSLAEAAAQSARALEAARVLERTGLAGPSETAEAERDAREGEARAAGARADAAAAFASLYEALGGGWEAVEAGERP